MGPMLFLMYKAPPVDVIRKSDMRFQHLYAYETQVYLPFKSPLVELAKTRIEACVSDIDI